MKVKEESEKKGLKLNIQKTKIMAVRPITSWQIDGETMETVTDFIFLDSKVTAGGNFSLEIKRCLLLERKAIINLESVLKSRHYFASKDLYSQSYGFSIALGFPGGLDGKESAYSVGDLGLIPGPGRSPGEGNGNTLQYSCLENLMDRGAWQSTVYEIAKSQTWLSDFTFFVSMVFPVVMYGCECWTIKKAECRRIDAFELWCWRRLLRVPWTARRSNQSILKEISPGCSLEGLMLKLKLQ